MIDTQVDINDSEGSEGDALVIGGSTRVWMQGSPGGEITWVTTSLPIFPQCELDLVTEVEVMGDRPTSTARPAGATWSLLHDVGHRH